MSSLTSSPLPALLVTALAALALSGCTIDLDLGDAPTRRVEERTIDVADVGTVDVTTDNGRIHVVGDEVAEIELRAELVESDEGDAGVDVAHDGERLTIDGVCDGAGWFDHCKVELELVVPADLDVRVETGNGDVVLDGLGAGVEIETDNGAIEGDDLGSTQATARTDNGRIELAFARPPDDVDVATDNGAIVVRVPGDGTVYDVDATSDNGSIDIDVPVDRSAGRSIVADSDNGSIDIDPTG